MHQVQVFVFLLTLAVRGIESLDFCFNASLEGSRLNSPILKKVDVLSIVECILSCVQEPCCRSINYRQRLPQGHASLCEMLHDVVYNTSAELEKNRFYDYMYLNEPQKEYNSNCVTDKDTTQEFDLEFPSKYIENYILLDNNVPEMSNMTLMFWINTLQAGRMVVLSYAVEETAEELSVMVKRDTIMLKIQSFETLKFPVPPINDGYWHHVGVAWSLGQYAIYLDGTLIYSGNGLGLIIPLKANGVFAIGQKLLSTNGTFDCNTSFSGKLSQVNVWNYDFTSVAGINMTSISQNCSNTVGNIINWSALQDRASGMVVKEQPRSCEPLRNNPEYDIIARPVNFFNYIETSIDVPSLQAVTITLWKKQLWSSTRYVHFSSSTAGTLLSFEFRRNIFTLKIAGASKMKFEAKIPTNRDVYWHHIATTWSSDTGHWKIYLDGSLVSIMHGVASGVTIPAGGQLVLDDGSSERSLSRLNIWDYEIDGLALSLMANKGPLFENGNVFAWYGAKTVMYSYSVSVDFQITPSDLWNSRSRSVHQIDFPEASTANYVMIENVFPYTLQQFTACFWAKILRTDCSIFTYSTPTHADEIAAYFYPDHTLVLGIKGEWNDPGIGPVIFAPNSWHFYCMQWKSSNGLVQTYQDGIQLEIGHKAVGYTIPSYGTMVLGQELDAYAADFESQQAFKGSLAGLNFWTYILNRDEIQGMAAGVINVYGNLLQWRDFRNHAFGNVSIVERCEAEIPEYRVQALRDQWCEKNITDAFTYARFVRNQDTGYMWRCIEPEAMLDENMCYSISKGSVLYHTRNDQLLGIN